MKTSARLVGAVTWVVLSVPAGWALGQPAASAGPSIASASGTPINSAAPRGSMATAEPIAAVPTAAPRMDGSPLSRSLPPGHPPIDGSMSPTRGPGPVDDPTIPASTIVVEAKGLPPDVLRTLEASLVAWHRGEEATVNVQEKRFLDASGNVRFSVVKPKEGVAFSVVIDHQGVPYASPTFRLSEQAGKRVPVRLFAITSDMDKARVGVQAFVYVEPRDHHVHVEQMFQFTNLSEETWRTHSMPIRLPKQARGVSTGEDSGPLVIKYVPNGGVMMEGVVPPGVVEMAFQYEMPYPRSSSLAFDLGMPPRVGAVRIMTALGPGLNLSVPGFGQPSTTRNENGQRILVINHAVQPNEDQIERFSFTIDGLPQKTLPRWLTLGLTMLLMVSGAAAAFVMRRSPVKSHSTKTLRQQRESLLQDISTIEDEFQQGSISEDHYKSERTLLLTQLATLLAKVDSQQKNDAS